MNQLPLYPAIDSALAGRTWLIGAKISVIEAQLKMRGYLASLTEDYPRGAQARGIMDGLARIHGEIENLQEPGNGAGTGRLGSDGHSPAPASTTAPLALEKGPCVVCERITAGTDCGEFLCGVCQRKGDSK